MVRRDVDSIYQFVSMTERSGADVEALGLYLDWEINPIGRPASIEDAIMLCYL
jgi:hypothetical protein